MQQPRQCVHQFQTNAVMTFCSHPYADPHIGPTGCVGKNVAGGADILSILLGYRKLGYTAAPGIIMPVQLRAIEQRQAHIKIFIDEVNDGPVLAQTGQTKCHVRQWPNLP